MSDETKGTCFEFEVRTGQIGVREEIAYLNLLGRPTTRDSKLKPTIRLFELLGSYQGPDLLLDMTTDGILQGIEFDYEYVEEDDLLAPNGKPYPYKGNPNEVVGFYTFEPLNNDQVARKAHLRLPSYPRRGECQLDHGVQLSDVVGSYHGPSVLLQFTVDDTLFAIDFAYTPDP